MRHSSSTLPALAFAGLALVMPPATAFADSTAEPNGESPAQAAPVKGTVPDAPRKAVDRFSAMTAEMSPSDVTLRFDLLRWSDDAGRADVVAALDAGDPAGELLKLPTLGYIWASSSPVGFSLKYAHRAATQGGGERLTFVTDKALDHYEFKKWAPNPPLAAKSIGYGVVELYLDANGQGTGTFSLAADVHVDDEHALVTLADGAPRLLTKAQAEPKPYAEQQGQGS